MSGFESAISGGSDCQSFRTWLYSARLNASVASRSRAEPVDVVGVPASAGGRLMIIVQIVSNKSIWRCEMTVQRLLLLKNSDRRSFTMSKVYGPWLERTDCRRIP